MNLRYYKVLKDIEEKKLRDSDTHLLQYGIPSETKSFRIGKFQVHQMDAYAFNSEKEQKNPKEVIQHGNSTGGFDLTVLIAISL